MTTSATGSSNRSRLAAFTLIELSIAVFIMAMFMAVSIPYFVRSYNNSVLNAIARSLVTTCQYARLQAVLHQRNATLHIDLDRQMFWVSQAAAPGAEDATDLVLKRVEVSQRASLVSAELAGFSVQQRGQVAATFYPNGTCEAVTVVVRGADKGSGVAVMVDPVTSRATPTTVKL